MMKHKITPSVDYNQLLKRLDTQLNKPTNLYSIKILKQDFKKCYYKTLGTSLHNPNDINTVA